MSNRSTSPSSLFAQSRASSPPMLPAPMSPIFLRVGMVDSSGSHVQDRGAPVGTPRSSARNRCVGDVPPRFDDLLLRDGGDERLDRARPLAAPPLVQMGFVPVLEGMNDEMGTVRSIDFRGL